MQILDGGGCGFLHRVSDPDKTGDLAIQHHEHYCLALVATGICLGGQVARLKAKVPDHRQIAERDRFAVDDPLDALAGDRLEIVGISHLHIALFRAAHDGLGKRVFRSALQRCGETQDLGLVVTGLRQDGDKLRLAHRQRAGLVDEQGIALLEPLQRLGVLDKYPGLGPPPRRRHDRHRRGEAERTGTGDDQHGDSRDQCVGQRRRGPPDRPCDEGQERDTDHGRNEISRHFVGILLDRCARPLRVGDHLDDLRQHRVGSDPRRLHHEAAGAVDGGTGQRVALGLLDWHGFSGDHAFVD